MIKAVFLDRDGTVNVGVPKYERVSSLDQVELLPNTLEALKLLTKLDYKILFITNQAGIAEGLISVDQFWKINDKVLMLLSPSGAKILKTYLCPHGANDKCPCRKLQPELLLDASREFNIDLHNSWMIGDRTTDV